VTDYQVVHSGSGELVMLTVLSLRNTLQAVLSKRVKIVRLVIAAILTFIGLQFNVLSGAPINSAHAATFDCASVTEIPLTECNTLVALYNSTGGANWINHTNWVTTSTPCSWYAVTCDAGHVTKILLTSSCNPFCDGGGDNLTGTLPDVSALTNLVTFELGQNQLSGNMPTLTSLTNGEGI